MPEFTSALEVELVQHIGTDDSVAAAARVSTGLDLAEYSETKNNGLINYLMKQKHGSPFEHNSMTFRIKAPIFVFREFHRHRVGWSYNEISGRYTKLAPNFYVYPEGRPLVQQGSGAHPKLVDASPIVTKVTNGFLVEAYSHAWRTYCEMLNAGVANEVARAVLPVGLFSEMYATCNARSLMSFLTLRVDHPSNTFTTKPQWEIQNVAEQMEAEFKKLFPLTWASFVMNGRVAP